jgi:putative peptidoglycan lipid II flippase
MREYDTRGEDEAWDFANVLLTAQLIVLLGVVTLVACFPGVVIPIFTEWTADTNPEQYRLVHDSLPWLAPALICLSLGSTTYMLLNGYKKFFLAAFGDASWKICVVLALCVGMGLFGWDYRVLIFGLLVGSVAKLVTHLLGMLSKLRLFRPSFRLRSPALKTMVVLMLPLLVGIVFAKFRDVFNNIYVLTHVNQKGLLQSMDFGRKLFASLQWLVPYALQIALFPFLCELVDRDDRESLGQVLSTSCKLLLAVFVPGSVLLAVLAKPISVFIFLGGETGLQVALWSGITTACYILVLPAAAMECVLMQGYFADRKTTAVTVIGVLTSLVSVLISYVLIVVVGVQAFQALMVVALGFVFSRYLKSTILTVVLRRSVPMFPVRESASFLLRLCALAAIVGLAGWGVSHGVAALLPDGLAVAEQKLAAAGADQAGHIAIADASEVHIDRMRMLLRLAVAGSAGGIVFLAGAFLLRVREPFDMVRWAWQKVADRKARKNGQQDTHNTDAPETEIHQDDEKQDRNAEGDGSQA